MMSWEAIRAGLCKQGKNEEFLFNITMSMARCAEVCFRHCNIQNLAIMFIKPSKGHVVYVDQSRLVDITIHS